MNDIFEKRLASSSDALASRVGNETVILHLKSSTYFGLDPVATRIWTLLEEGITAVDICARLATEYNAEPEVIEADVRNFLTELEANAIVHDGAGSGG